MGLLLAATLGLAALLLVVALGAALGEFRQGRARILPREPERLVEARGDLAEWERATIALFEAAAPSVVHIDTSSVPLAALSALVAGREWSEGSGSGVVWDRAGHLLTSHHVIAGARTIVVTLGDRSRYPAEVVGSAPTQDLAVLRIHAPAERLRPIPLGTSAELRVGQAVFAIGNPFGLDQSLSAGVLGGLDRTARTADGHILSGLLQTDAALFPGSSGGPLLDSAGRLIGVGTAVSSVGPVLLGLSFAVPVDTVQRLVPRLLERGSVQRVALGVVPADRALLRELDIDRGVPVGLVVPGSPAERAGLRSAEVESDGTVHLDLIVAVGEEPVATLEDLAQALSTVQPGETVRLRVLRDGGSRDLELEVAELTELWR
jgi:S1-C subfamily serine protease